MTTEETLLWNSRIEAWKTEIQRIIIPADIDPIVAKTILHKLSILYDQIRPCMGDILKKYKQTEQYMELVKNKNYVGSNEAERKRNSVVALESFTMSDERVINFFEIISELEGKKEDLNSLIDMIEKKNSICITMSGLLKMETSLGIGR